MEVSILSTTHYTTRFLSRGISDRMASGELSATLRFLTDAGHLMAATSAETSAFLMRQRDGLMLENKLSEAETQRQHVCGCCGHIMILGRGSSLSFRSGKRTAKGGKVLKPHQSLMKFTTCGYCESTTEVTLPAPLPISRRPTKSQRLPEAGPESSTTIPDSDSGHRQNANTSSKKRAKSRKAGLQALLDQSKATKAPGPGLGLSLAHFMQK